MNSGWNRGDKVEKNTKRDKRSGEKGKIWFPFRHVIRVANYSLFHNLKIRSLTFVSKLFTMQANILEYE